MFTVTLSDWFCAHEYCFVNLADAWQYAKEHRPCRLRTPLLVIDLDELDLDHV